MPTMTETKCPSCGHSSPSERLCHRCHTSTVTMIQDLGEYWLMAHQELAPGKGGTGGSSNEPSLGINVAALSLIAGDDILRLLHSYENLTRAGRKLTPPALLKQKTLQFEIFDAIRFAVTHIEWMATQEWFADFVVELKALHRSAKAAARQFPEPVRRIACPGDTVDGLPCGNSLNLRIDDLLELFTCKRCKTEWSSMRLIAVALASPTAEIWVDVEAIAAWLHISERRVQQLVKEHKIPRKGLLVDLKKILATRE